MSMTREEIEERFGDRHKIPADLQEMVEKTIAVIAIHHNMEPHEIELLNAMSKGIYVSGINNGLDIVKEILREMKEIKIN